MNESETNEILNTGLSTGRPYLGSPKVVEGVLREYLVDLTSLRTAHVEKGEDMLPHLLGQAKLIQDIFYGADARFLPFAWNKPESLGAALVNECGIGGEISDAVIRVAVRIAKEFLSDLIAFEEGRIDESHMQVSVDELVKRYSAILSGAAMLGDRHGR